MKHVLNVDVCEKDGEYVIILYQDKKSTTFKVNTISEGFEKIDELVSHDNICFINKEKRMREYFKKLGIEEKFYIHCIACDKSWPSENWPQSFKDFVCEDHKKKVCK